MRERIVSGNGGDRSRLRNGQRRIEDGHSERNPRIAAGHLRVRVRVGDDRVALRLAAGSRRRRNPDRRQQRAARLAVAAVITHRAAARQDEVDALCAVERAAAAKRHDRIDPRRRRDQAPGFNHARVGVGVEIVKARGGVACGPQQRHRFFDVASRDDAGIGNEQGMSTPQVADEVSETPECGIAEDDTGGWLETEGNERRQCPILAPPHWRSGPAGNSAMR